MSELISNKLAKPSGESTPTGDAKPWRILVVDDEAEVHDVTRLALRGFSFAGRRLLLESAYSGHEARVMLRERDPYALVLLDVVMETEHEGLDLVGFIREDLQNKFTRIVLRTGQPGQAPERAVIEKYDINDYKEKTELTSQKLYTLMHASLRSYRDIMAIEESRQGLRKIINASASFFSFDSLKTLAEGALEQLLSLLHLDESTSAYVRRPTGIAALRQENGFQVLASTGEDESLTNPDRLFETLETELADELSKIGKKTAMIDNGLIVSRHRGKSGHENYLVVQGDFRRSDIDHDLIELYARNVGMAFENFDLARQIEETQREIVYRLGEAAETRSMETGNHLKRVAEMSALLAELCGLNQEEVNILRYASPLHDVGKIGIPDAILNKPGKLDADEWTIMQTHAELGHRMLKTSEKPILRAGAIIALEHHEKWDGTGYPNGKSGEDIHIFARITAIADVFDALSSKRCYKEAWCKEEVHAHFVVQRGKHFDPNLADLLRQNLGKFDAIMDAYQDK